MKEPAAGIVFSLVATVLFLACIAGIAILLVRYGSSAQPCPRGWRVVQDCAPIYIRDQTGRTTVEQQCSTVCVTAPR